MEANLIKAFYRSAECCEECRYCNSHIFCERNAAWIKGEKNMVCDNFERKDDNVKDKKDKKP
jgi:hypothetical protein